MDSKLILSLISCEKEIKSAPRKVMAADPRNEFTLRNDFTCISKTGTIFEVFMRTNVKFPYLFSIGLRYKSPEGTFTLCRYNGKHLHRNKIANSNQFDDFHVHRLYDIQLSDGSDAILDAEPTKDYASFDEALFTFLNDCHIRGWEKYFPHLENNMMQTRLDGV